MRCVVTGGAGFLGSHLADRLLASGHEVLALDNFVTGSRDNVAHLVDNPAFQLRHADVAEPFDVEGPVDFVFHFASPASPVDFKRIPFDVLKAGSFATHRSLELAERARAKFMLASTSEVYGDPLVHPQPETYWGNVNPQGPRAVYDEAKRYAEAATVAYRDFCGVDVRCVRFFNTYGPRMRLDDGRVVPNFIRQALLEEPLTIYGDGSQTRSFGYYADIVEAVYRLAMSDYRQPVNIGAAEERTILEFAHAVLAATGSKSEIVTLPAEIDDPQQRRPDLTRAKSVLNWEPTTTLEEGLRATVDYFRRRIAA
jgi:dTDP-glucose 4,6-dehydratase